MELTSITSPLNPRAVVACSISIQKPSRLAQRTNHLRPKILKTLSSNPIPPPVTIATPLIIHENEETLTSYDVDEESSSVELLPAAETSEIDGYQTASSVGEESLDLGKLSTKSVFKFGAYFAGLFVFQTICAVWFMGSASSTSLTEKLKDSELGVDGQDKGKSLINGNAAIYLDGPEVERKIEEIRLMAREARRAERKKAMGEPKGGVIEEQEPVLKSRIEKEIGSRLNNLEKRLNSAKKSPALPKGASSSKEAGSDLMFKKKLKFGGASAGKSSQSPKGFGSEYHNPAASKANGNSQELRSDGIYLGNGANRAVPGKEMEVEDSKSKTGPLRKSSQESSSNEVVDSRTTKEICPWNPRGFRSSRKGTTKKSPGRSMSRQTDETAHFWWLNLPCVFAILMRRGSESEGPDGLYTLKTASEEDDESISSYIIGFEDRVDASNFCYLLESFFEDLGDFSADIVPLLRKELEEALKAKTMKILVLRKGQLRLYAGQPFSDVESELMSLVEQNQSAPR